MIFILFLFFVSSMNCSSLDHDGQGVPFDCKNGAPHAEQCETVVRCALTDGTLNMANYRGMDLFVETRHKETKRYLWFADVKFHSSDKGFFKQAFMHTASEVTIKYSSAPGLFQVPPSVEQPPLRLFHVDQISRNINAGLNKDIYKYFIDRSIIEFKLNEVMSLEELYKHVEEMKDPEMKFPKYTTAGYSHNTKAWNCAVFSAALLQKLGINLCASSEVLRNFIGSEYGDLKWSTGIGAVIGACVAVGAVMIFPPAAGAVGAAVMMGPAAAGGLGGIVLADGGKAAYDIVYDRAYPWVILNEVIVNHHRLNVKPSFVIPIEHTKKDDISRIRRSIIENDPDKYDKWYDHFMKEDSSFGTFIVRYNYKI